MDINRDVEGNPGFGYKQFQTQQDTSQETEDEQQTQQYGYYASPVNYQHPVRSNRYERNNSPNEQPPFDYGPISVFVLFCCCWVLGRSAFKKNKEAKEAYLLGDVATAKTLAMESRNYIIAGLVGGVIVLTGIGLLLYFKWDYIKQLKS